MFTRMAFADTPYDGDVLVVLSLRGGFDSLQAIVPTGDAHYATWRPNIAIPQGQLLPLGGIFGMHPAMAPLKPFYDAGDLGMIHAVGMAEPNRSHFSAMEEMERAAPGLPLRTGWLDRVLGLRDVGTAFQATQLGSNTASSAFLGPEPGARDVVGGFLRAERRVGRGRACEVERGPGRACTRTRPRCSRRPPRRR